MTLEGGVDQIRNRKVVLVEHVPSIIQVCFKEHTHLISGAKVDAISYSFAEFEERMDINI